MVFIEEGGIPETTSCHLFWKEESHQPTSIPRALGPHQVQPWASQEPVCFMLSTLPIKPN